MALESEVIFKASCAALRSESTRPMPSTVAGSLSWVMNIRADLPSGDRNIFRPRSKSGFVEGLRGQVEQVVVLGLVEAAPIARAVSLVASIWSSRAFCELYDASDRSLLAFIDAIVCGRSAVSCGASVRQLVGVDLHRTRLVGHFVDPVEGVEQGPRRGAQGDVEAVRLPVEVGAQRPELVIEVRDVVS